MTEQERAVMTLKITRNDKTNCYNIQAASPCYNRDEASIAKGVAFTMPSNHITPVPIPDRFWSKVNKDGPTVRHDLGPCWLWIGYICTSGYGRLTIKQYPQPAHRLSWELHLGPVPDGLWVLHRCDVPACVRPDHLFLGTHADNMADMKAKSRGRGGTAFHKARARWKPRNGEHGGGARLTAAQVEEIRRRYVASGVTLRSLALEYGVHNSTVGRVLKGQTWKSETTAS